MSINDMEMFPVNGKVFDLPTGRWSAKVVNKPEWFPENDRLLFEIEFADVGKVGAQKRILRLWVSRAALHTERETYVQRPFRFIETWLATPDKVTGEVECFGN